VRSNGAHDRSNTNLCAPTPLLRVNDDARRPAPPCAPKNPWANGTPIEARRDPMSLSCLGGGPRDGWPLVAQKRSRRADAESGKREEPGGSAIQVSAGRSKLVDRKWAAFAQCERGARTVSGARNRPRNRLRRLWCGRAGPRLRRLLRYRPGAIGVGGRGNDRKVDQRGVRSLLTRNGLRSSAFKSEHADDVRWSAVRRSVCWSLSGCAQTAADDRKDRSGREFLPARSVRHRESASRRFVRPVRSRIEVVISRLPTWADRQNRSPTGS